MKPILKDNIYRGHIKKELFFKTSFFAIFINRHLRDIHSLNVTPQYHSITHINYRIFTLVPFFTSFKTFSHLISKLSIINIYIQ